MDVATKPREEGGTGGKRSLRSDLQNRGRALEATILINI